MRSVSRRTILTASGVAALAATLSAPQIAVAEDHGGSEATAGDTTLLDNIIAGLAGTNSTNAAEAVQPKLTGMHSTATKNLAALIAEPATELFPKLPLGSSESNLASTYEKLYEIAVATAMPVPAGATVPSDLSGNSEAKQKVISGLRWLYDSYFSNQDAGYYGNWYHWEIGIPTHVGRILALLREDVATSDPSWHSSTWTRWTCT